MAKKSSGKPKPPPGFIRTLELKHTKRVAALAFSPRGKVIASASQDRTVKLGNTETGKLIAVQPPGEFQYEFVAVAVSPDGYTVASVSQAVQKSRQGQMEACLWQPLPGSRTQPGREERYSYPFSGVGFSPAGRVVAFACDVVRLFDVDTGQERNQVTGEKDHPLCVGFSPNGNHLATGHDDGAVAVWNAEGKRLWALRGHSGPVTALAFAPDGELLATADDKEIRLWPFPKKGAKPKRVFGGAWQRTTSLAFLPDSLRLVSFHDPEGPGTVRQWHAEQENAMGEWSPAGEEVSCVALAHDGRWLATGGASGKVDLFDRGVVLDEPGASTPAAKPSPAASGRGEEEDYFAFTDGD